MSIALYERVTSRPVTESQDDKTITIVYLGTGTTSEIAMRDYAMANTSLSYWGLWRKSLNIEPAGGGPYWNISVEYGGVNPGEVLGEPIQPPSSPDPDQPLGVGHGFTTSGGTVHIMQSRATIAAYYSGGVAAIGTDVPDFKKAINASKEGVDGCDIVAPNAEFTIENRRDFVTLNYFQTLFRLTGTVNNATWKNFLSGEMLYLGCEGRYTSGDRWLLTHKFAAEPNQINLPIGDITVLQKRGWDYLWVGYSEPKKDGAYKVKQPIAAYVEQVYRYENFAQLELGI